MAGGKTPSSLLLAEYFSSQDVRFLPTLRQLHNHKSLPAFINRWKADPRPWARQQIFAYIDDDTLPGTGDRLVIKRLFKHAEERGDHELVGLFMLAFDRMIRRSHTERWHWDSATGESWSEPALVAPPTAAQTFSTVTRLYLRRRAWRYFRFLAHRKPDEYLPALCEALKHYRDGDLERGENILDCWGLVHACFFHSDVIAFNANHANLVPGRRLAELQPAPYRPELWEDAPATKPLLNLLSDARSRLVRVWAAQLLRRHHLNRLGDVELSAILPLLRSDDAEIQQLGMELLERHPSLPALSPEAWLGMLDLENPAPLGLVCQLIEKHMPADRVDPAMWGQLACRSAVPVARLGLRMLQALAAPPRAVVAALAEVRCSAIGHDAALWALGIVGAAGAYDLDAVGAFFDSPLAETRQGAWQWLGGDVPGHSDPALFARLIETPHEDLRLELVEMLHARAGLPGAGPEALAPLWCAVLLGIHRGGRHKIKALVQISDVVRRDPASAEQLMPILAVAIRSVRPAEARHGLAAIVSAVEHRPELAAAVARYLPELNLMPQGVA